MFDEAERRRLRERLAQAARKGRPWPVGGGDNASAVVNARVGKGVGLSATTTTETILFATQPFASAGANTQGEDGFFSVGRLIRIYVSGFLTTIGTAGTVTLNMRLNSISGNSLGASVAIVPVISITKGAWEFTAYVSCRSVGSTGTLIGSGEIQFGTTVVTAPSAGATFLLPNVNSDATATIDTTLAGGNQIVITTLMTQAHTMTTQIGVCEVLN